jgi:hypothetical protein
MPAAGSITRLGLPLARRDQRGGLHDHGADRQYLARPYYGSQRTVAWLATQGHVVNRKRVQRLMRLAGLVAIYQRRTRASRR